MLHIKNDSLRKYMTALVHTVQLLRFRDTASSFKILSGKTH